MSNVLIRAALATVLIAGATSAYAGNFVNLTNGVGGNVSASNGGLITGTNNNNADPTFIQTLSATYLAGYDDLRFVEDGGTGNVVATAINYNTFVRTGNTNVSTGTGTLTLLDWRVSTDVPLLAGIPQATIYDFVYRDSADNKLVFASRYLNQVDNNQEVNYMFRYGFTGYETASAWTYATDNDLRQYQAGRTADISFNNVVPFDADAVRQKADVSVTEGNPWSGLYLVKTNATDFIIGNKAIGFYQAGEEGQAVAGGFISGFVPTAIAAVPEPENYALMVAGLGLVGFASRRKKD